MNTPLDKVKELKSSKTLLENVPIPFSFRENYISAIIGDKIYQNRIIKNISELSDSEAQAIHIEGE